MNERRFNPKTVRLGWLDTIKRFCKSFKWCREEAIFVEVFSGSPEYELAQYEIGYTGIPPKTFENDPKEPFCVVCLKPIEQRLSSYTRITLDNRQEWIHGHCLSDSSKKWECVRCSQTTN